MKKEKKKSAQTARSIIYIILIVVLIGGLAYLGFRSKENGAMQGMVTLENGLQYEITKEGSGPGIKSGEVAVVNYTGRLEDGTVFDSNVDPAFGHTVVFEFVIDEGAVIKGWDIGVKGMKVGEKRTLVLPPELGYGSSSIGLIPPNATLIFDVELLEIKQD
ncbi:MAG: FKBP-type peptidyl-prolyl cis-trans isomerase [Candidatus Pacebacteria bacterium]|jgi:peptidylprolyl isomerase|nr:FKBP-type peptidyl-prolyl cis-trans isomerase [Candidatus Paceibacterota bacterium]